MFSKRSSDTPSDSPERRRLVDLFRHAHKGEKFTLDDVAERVHSRRDLVAFWLGRLTADRIIDQYVAIISPAANSGIRSYDRLDQVPAAIFDPFQMKEIDVDPSLLRVYFTRHEENALSSSGSH